MGDCIYCKKPVGWFRNKHPECEAAHRAEQEQIAARRQAGRAQIISLAKAALGGVESMADLPAAVARLKSEHDVPDEDLKSLLINEWECAVDAFLDDGLLTKNEERRLVEFARGCKVNVSESQKYDRLVKSAALSDLVDGRIPDRFRIPEGLPVNLRRGETIVWARANTAYLEDKVRRQYVGGSQGVSIRIMSGVYYRVGAFKARPVERVERVHVDDGWLVVTDKNIYFAGQRKSLRIPYPKIVSFEPFSDGIGLHRDGVTAKPQVFITGDGWFTYNLVTNLARI